MNGDAGEAEALDRLIAQWAARIARTSSTTVEAILMQAENVLNAVSDLRPYGPKARRMLQAHSRLSQSMVSKLEAIGQHAGLMRLKAAKLPPSVSSLYALTQKPRHLFLKSIEIDLRGASPSEIALLFTPGTPAKTTHKLMTIKVPLDVGEASRLELIADIKIALGRIAEDHGIDLRVYSRRKR